MSSVIYMLRKSREIEDDLKERKKDSDVGQRTKVTDFFDTL